MPSIATAQPLAFPNALGQCASLPSSNAAADLLQGKAGGFGRVVFWTGVRAALVGLGLAAVGERKHLVRNAIAGALAIEVFVLTWIATHEEPS